MDNVRNLDVYANDNPVKYDHLSKYSLLFPNEQLETELEASRSLIQSDTEQHHIPHGKESVQEKKILSQENKIQRFNEQVQDLRRQLVQCRNENQRFSSSTNFVMSPLMAEGLAMREAIRKSKELGIRRLRCESDSSQLIKALNSYLLSLWRFVG
ncbi:unnamed protein product [Brassica napus]|uniref:(rape) hypothetical protein n=1 Tax=Brassica napus TaxID=3708 RepID=A0A817B3M8_BRANA|nr:unnamed protein product [Brassica napus]